MDWIDTAGGGTCAIEAMALAMAAVPVVVVATDNAIPAMD